MKVNVREPSVKTHGPAQTFAGFVQVINGENLGVPGTRLGWLEAAAPDCGIDPATGEFDITAYERDRLELSFPLGRAGWRRAHRAMRELVGQLDGKLELESWDYDGFKHSRLGAGGGA